MSGRTLMTRSLAFTVAVAVVAVPLAAQQDTTRLRRSTTSDKRINVSKGEVELPPRVDTVFVRQNDTVRVSVLRIDTVTVAAPVPIIPERLLGSFYWGLFAGGTGPISDIDRINTNGYHAGGLVGWEPRDSWIGGRLTTSYIQVGREQGLPVALVGTELPIMWQFSGDLKAKANFGGWSLYGVGGLGFNSYKRLATVSDRPTGVTVVPLSSLTNFSSDDITVCEVDDNIACFRPATNNWRTAFSWNFGVGTDFHIGRQDMFLETRWNAISAHGAYTWYLPISLGVRYF